MSLSPKGAKFSIAQIPTLRDVSKEVVRLEEKITQISAQRGQIEAHRCVLMRETTDASAPAKRTKSRDDALVAAALGESTTVRPRDLGSELVDVVEKIRILDLALRMARNQLDIAKREASVLVCQQVSDAHESLGREIVTSLLALHRACVEYRAFTAELDSKDIEWAQLKPMFPRFLGDPNEYYSPIGFYLRDIVEAGRLDDVPKELR